MEVKTLTILRIICDDPVSSEVPSEIVLCEKRYDEYSPTIIDDELVNLINDSLIRANEVGVLSLKNANPQLCIYLSSDDDLRPALHLSSYSIKKLNEFGLSVDFDPYV